LAEKDFHIREKYHFSHALSACLGF